MRQFEGGQMLTTTDWKQISGHPLLREISPELINEILEAYGNGVSEFSDGEIISGRAQIGFLLSGHASVQTTDESRRVLLRFLTVGDAFGLAGLFSEEPEISKICADGSCRCVFFSEKAISRLLEISEPFRLNYIGFLSSRIRFLNHKIAYLTAGSAERKLALYLLSLGTGEVELKDSIGSLSELLNLGRASLYRAFDKLCEDGYLLKEGRKLTILNPEAMLNAYK